MSRHDAHAPSNFIPSDYKHLFSFKSASTSDGFVIRAINVEKLEDENMGAPLANVHPDIFQCDCCGARYVYGDALFHGPTHEVITLGWQCADKYLKLSNRKEFKGMLASLIRATKQAAWKKEGIEKAREFLKGKTELKNAFKAKHYIISDIRSKLIRWGSISAAQENFVIKLANEANAKAAETNAKAGNFVEIGVHPERVEITGKVTKQYLKEGEWYSKEVMTVEWEREDGKLSTVWGTAPKGLFDAWGEANQEPDRLFAPNVIGAQVTFSAAVEQAKGDDPTFGFFNKPTKFKVVSWGPKKS